MAYNWAVVLVYRKANEMITLSPLET